MDPEEIQQLLKTGIEAAQSGNKIIARHILEQVVSKDPANEMGWLWLSERSERATGIDGSCDSPVAGLRPATATPSKVILAQLRLSVLRRLQAGR